MNEIDEYAVEEALRLREAHRPTSLFVEAVSEVVPGGVESA
jgi:electron transfer flavoprotein alpha/beta subunit